MGKAKTKAQRRGRPRKFGSREPSGRPQRETVAEARSMSIDARMRQHGLSLAQAGERLAGYEIGRMYLRHEIDLVDVEVCDDYVQTVARFMALCNPQHPFPKAIDYLAVRGESGEPSQEQINAVRTRYTEWLKPLEECDSRARMTFHSVVFFDNPAGERLNQVKECIAALRKKFR